VQVRRGAIARPKPSILHAPHFPIAKQLSDLTMDLVLHASYGRRIRQSWSEKKKSWPLPKLKA
jgi:hypothetical protein